MTSNRPLLSAMAALLTLVAGSAAPAQEEKKPRVYSGTVHSHTYHVDKIYKSMEGPTGRRRFELPRTKEPELFWLVGYKAIVVDAESHEPVSQEFMCHSNLDIEADQPKVVSPHISGRLFTLSQGQQLITLPDNFGVPMLSTAKLRQGSQVLNLNLPDAVMDLKHAVDVMIVRDKETTEPFKPLYQREVQLMKSLDEPRYFGMKPGEGDPAKHGASCAVGVDPTGDSPLHRDQLGQEFTAHWVVKPGREVSRANVTRWLNLHQDTTIHYISMHLHPFAESLELFDVTAAKSVWKGNATQRKDRIGLERVDFYSSQEGLPIYKDHEYELISVYDNTSGVDQDAMAVLFLYLLDNEFKKPQL